MRQNKSRLNLLLLLSLVFFISIVQGGVTAQDPLLEPCAVPMDNLATQGGLTVGALGLTPGALGLTPGALGLTPGALALTPGALGGLTPGALALTPGALTLPANIDEYSDAQIQQLLDEIQANLIDYTWLDGLLPPIEAGHQYGQKPVAFIIVDDFEDVETAFRSHGELVEQIALELTTLAGVPNVQVVRVDITDGINNFVVNDRSDGTKGIASRINETVTALQAEGFTRFILNLSFGLWPCDDTITVGGKTITVSVEDFSNFRESQSEQQPITGILECVAHNPDGTYTAHFGYLNPNDYPVVIPYGSENKLTGGGLYADELIARTPTYFGVPDDNPARPNGSNFYPNSAFQVVFRSLKYPLVWTHQGGTSTAGKYSPICAQVIFPDESYALSVESFVQGKRSNGTYVSSDRSDEEEALGQPERDDSLNFVALGFGGEIVLAFDAPRFANPYGPDLEVVETSFNNPTPAQYPEIAKVWVSQDKVNWVFLGTASLDETFELPASLPWFQYVKIKDVTNLYNWKKGHYGTGDGYDVDGIVACGNACVPEIEPIFECVQPSGAGYIAHFGYRNTKGASVFVAHGAGSNYISGGGLSGKFLTERPPELFGYPDVLVTDPGRTQYYPNSAFQVTFDGSPLSWSILGPDGTLRMATATLGEGGANLCNAIVPVNDTNFADYLATLGVTGAESQTVINELVGNPQLEDPNFNDLIPLLQMYLNRSASPSEDFALIPFAAAGNSAPTLGSTPLAPARLKETVAVGALLGQNPGTFASGFSHDGNVATPGAWYRFAERLFGPGTSYAAPFAGAYAAAYLTFAADDACDFVDPANPGVGRVPLVHSEFDWSNRTVEVELDCQPPMPSVVTPTCNGLAATVYVDEGIIVGGQNNGKSYSTGEGSRPLIGTNGNDVIVGTNAADQILGRSGDDVICGLLGNDFIHGDNGDDTIFGGATNIANDPSGKDTIQGGNGNDVIYGGDNDDTLVGQNGSDTIDAGTGKDTVDGGNGNDTLIGQDGEDSIHGGNGNDTIDAGAGADEVYAGKGNDIVTGGPGNDYLNGQQGNDQLLDPEPGDTKISFES